MTVNFMTRQDNSLNAFQSWLMGFPRESLERLRQINMSTGSSKHIILTLAFGLYDGHIRKLNQTITFLLIARLKAERAGKERLVTRINSFMENIHVAVDSATNTCRLSVNDSSGRPVCIKAKSAR